MKLESRVQDCKLPDYPSSSWLTDYTKPEKRTERALALQRYFDELVLVPEVLVAQEFHEQLQLPADVAAVMCNIAAHVFEQVRPA